MKFLLLTLFNLLLTSTALARPQAEHRERVYVIDSGVQFFGALAKYKCKNGHVNFSGSNASKRHGTSMAITIARNLNPRTHCLVSIHFFNEEVESGNMKSYMRALEHVRNSAPGFINLSIYGNGNNKKEKLLLTEMADSGFKIAISSGNKGVDLSKNCNAFPACHFITRHDNVKVCSSYVFKGANYGGPVTDVDGSDGGTSFSTANILGIWIKNLSN